jgi:hypothetical protein
VPRADPVHAQRLTAQLLSGPKANSAEAVVDRLLAVQGQDPRGFRLSIRSRSSGVLESDVVAALTERRSLIVTWLNRGTLHLVQADDYWWLHPLTTRQLATSNGTRLRQEGVSPEQADRGVEVIHGEVSSKGPRTRLELKAALDAAGIPTAGQALVHLLFAASLRGDLIRGPVRGNEQCFVKAAEWLGGPPAAMDRAEALGRLAARYLAGHGPASMRDLMKWAGLTLGDARIAIANTGDGLVERADGLLDLPDRANAAPIPPPRLLGPYDPVLLGWESRDAVVGTHEGIVTSNGLFRPFAMVDGRAVATWGLDSGRVTLRPLEPLSKTHREALAADASAVLRYLGLPDTPPIVEPNLLGVSDPSETSKR